MGHPQRSDARDNRNRILAVTRVAVATGDTAVTVREIARRAEVGTATVYRHFSGRDALFAAAGRMPVCSRIVADGLATDDAWEGFALVVERLMEARALDRSAGPAASTPPPAVVVDHAAGDRERAFRLLLRLVGRAKEAGDLRADLVVSDVVLALMANEGVRVAPPTTRVAASRRLAALMIQSFRARPDPEPLPPAVRLPPVAGHRPADRMSPTSSPGRSSGTM
ncbi:TetR/AcrR family transcriptional regulator [Pseudonocardia endophytica]|uniref:TetR family transcriptional regulator n=1 Tax=Pseudonocardia endophytica TaxID=401976 RepID=A0A4V2PHU7_PSEEN|nr:TetR/AcrR family transcriptional regulator [Pseudonocardia endophytica]TCK22146.1 TetR family transcriptional regulator [Pseudonocardia endophytica]